LRGGFPTCSGSCHIAGFNLLLCLRSHIIFYTVTKLTVELRRDFREKRPERKIVKWCFRLLTLFKEKSWSVRLSDGHVLNNQVRTENCGDCESRSYLVARNYSDPNVVLFGCNGHRCKHKLIRLRVNSDWEEPEGFEELPSILQNVS